MRRLTSTHCAQLVAVAAALVALTAPRAGRAPPYRPGRSPGPSPPPPPTCRSPVCASAPSRKTQKKKSKNSAPTPAANGAYSIGELPEAKYAVEFIPAAGGLNYVYQAWNGKSDPFDANLVKVTTGEVPGIDAALSEGGTIGGLVTSYSSGAPIAGVEVCAEPESLDAVTRLRDHRRHRPLHDPRSDRRRIQGRIPAARTARIPRPGLRRRARPPSGGPSRRAGWDS